MSSLPVDAIKSFADQHPKPPNVHFQYGTAGFRTLYVLHLDGVDRGSDECLGVMLWTP